MRIYDKLSHSKPISHGVLQDSLLFLIHIKDVFIDLDCETILYADDATILVHVQSLPDVFTAANNP